MSERVILPAVAWMEAFLAAQKEFPTIAKTKTADTGSYTYKFADLGDVLATALPILHKHGLALSQPLVSSDGRVGVGTRIYHEKGHVEEFGELLLPSGNTPQTGGSALTYSRRYAACAALGIVADEDDDGAAASKRQESDSTAGSGEVMAASADGYHCPACRAVNGEIVTVKQRDKKPFWQCTLPAGECAGTSGDGKWPWGGWDQDYDKSASIWLSDNGYSPVVKDEPESESPGDWLKTRVDMFGQWGEEERRQAYKAVMEEFGFERLSNLDRAGKVFEAMKDAYFTEFPDLAPF